MKRLELLEALKRVMPGVETKSSLLEGADSFMFDGEWIKTFNDEISASYPFDSGIKCLVKAQEFFKILSRIEADEIKMVMLDDGKLQMSGGKTVLKMVSSDSSSLVKLVDNLALAGIKWNKLPKDFLKALKLSADFAATNKAFSSLCGVSFGNDGLAASDRIRAGFYKMKIREFKEDFVLSTGSVRELVKFEALEEFSLGDSWVHFKDKNGLQFSTRKVVVDFPRAAIKKFLDFEGVDDHVYSFPANLGHSVERASVLSYSNDEGSEYVELSMDQKGNMIVAGAKQYGEIKEKIAKDDKWSFPKDAVLKIDPKVLIDLLSLGNEFYLKENRYILLRHGDFESIIALVS